MGKHAKGPWQAAPVEGYSGIWCVEEDGKHLGFIGSATLGEEEAEAITALFVAAPDLLAACESFLAVWDGNGDGNDMAWAAGKARAAIRKAKGEAAKAAMEVGG